MNAKKKIHVLVVDDSAFMRKAISKILESDPEIKVVGTASSGEECLEKVPELQPDIVALDLDMPGMGGLEALRRLMKENPVPVVVISALTYEGAQITFEALESGAQDFIYKDILRSPLDILKKEHEIITKVKEIAKKGIALIKPVKTPEKRAFRSLRGEKVIAIGTSTGGPVALENVLKSLPDDIPSGIVITQHMPDAFVKPFADRLNRLTKIDIVVAEDGAKLEPRVAYIAPGSAHLVLERTSKGIAIRTAKSPKTLYMPSVDIMFKSVAQIYGDGSVGVVLTGMGNDGKEGAREIKKAGGVIIAQDESTCVVYGMPKAVIESGLADKVVPLDKIPEAILEEL